MHRHGEFGSRTVTERMRNLGRVRAGAPGAASRRRGAQAYGATVRQADHRLRRSAPCPVTSATIGLRANQPRSRNRFGHISRPGLERSPAGPVSLSAKGRDGSVGDAVGQQDARELGSGADGELAVHAGQVSLHRLAGEKEGGRDLRVVQSTAGGSGDLQFLGAELLQRRRFRIRRPVSADPLTGSGQLRSRPGRPGLRAQGVEQGQSALQWGARGEGAASPPQRLPSAQQGSCLFERDRADLCSAAMDSVK